MVECNRPLRSTLPLDMRQEGTMFAKHFAGDLPLAEHVQHWGHLAHLGHKQ